MNRRQCIRHEDQVFSGYKRVRPTEPATLTTTQEIFCALPFLTFMLVGYVWMFLQIFGVID